MKPRLESAPETNEDVLIWLKVADRMTRRDETLTPVRFRCLGVRSLACDRRDADLMLHLRVAYGDVSADERRQSYRYRRVCHCAWAFQNLPYGPTP